MNNRQILEEKPKRLTEREIQILKLVTNSKLSKEIAFDLGISIKTVEKHRSTIMSKLRIHDVAGLTRYAIREGLIEA